MMPEILVQEKKIEENTKDLPVLMNEAKAVKIVNQVDYEFAFSLV